MHFKMLIISTDPCEVGELVVELWQFYQLVCSLGYRDVTQINYYHWSFHEAFSLAQRRHWINISVFLWIHRHQKQPVPKYVCLLFFDTLLILCWVMDSSFQHLISGSNRLTLKNLIVFLVFLLLNSTHHS